MVQVGPQWSQWILKWPQTVPESPRQSFKFQKSSQVLPFSYQLFISTARCSRRSSVSKFSDNLLLILKSHPSTSSIWVWPNWVNRVPESPRESQTVPESSRESQTVQDTHPSIEQFPTLAIFQDGYRLFVISTARCSRRSSVSKISDNLPLILKSHPYNSSIWV